MAHLPLALGMFCAVALCGVIAWGVAKWMKISVPTMLLSSMFGNSGNLGIPLAVLAFGEGALSSAVVLFAVSCMFHFSFGVWILDRKAPLINVLRVPIVLATLIGITLSILKIHLWPPLLTGLKMMGDISIPLMLFALGAKLSQIDSGAWKIGLFGGIVRPLIGMAASWCVAQLFGLQGLDFALLVIYGAMPPAALNYVICERYQHEPQRMASIVLVGNMLSVVFLPLVLLLTLK